VSDHFSAGDIAVCVDVQPRGRDPRDVIALRQLKLGGMYRVTSVVWDMGLTLEGIDHGHADGWAIDRFKRLPGASKRFTARIRACRPVKQEEPA